MAGGRQIGRQPVKQKTPGSYGAAGQSQTNSKHGRSKQKRRAQNALSIAEYDYEDKPGLKRSRLGEVEPGFRKRQRDSEGEDGDSEEDDTATRHKRARSDMRERYGKDAEYVSDSEGEDVVMGQVDDEDDEDLDSDAAFGESDEERFEGFKFSGSRGKAQSSKSKKSGREGDLLDEGGDSGDEEELDSGEESDNFKENAVDLATMLDDDFEEEDSEEDDKQHKRSRKESRSLDSEEDDAIREQSDSDHLANQNDFSDDEEEDEEERMQNRALLNDLVAGFDTGDRTQEREDKARIRAQEAIAPSAAPKTSAAELLAELNQGIGKKITKSSGKGLGGVVDVPLAQRQQGRLDRAAAFEKSKETLNRWVDTIKHNRRAEHLEFPLHSKDELSAKNTDRLQSLVDSKPFNNLESTIQNILVESGIASTPGKNEEDAGLQLEGVPEKQLTLAEVKARNIELRRARELLFREETKAKRIKKIKSKSYRRVHRKERERDLARQQEADAEEGIVPSEDEQDRLDRLRAEERMGAKHRESKWAKAMKSSGRANWDEDAKAGVVDMARREAELKRRMLGQTLDGDASGEEEGSEFDSEVSDSEANAQIKNELFRLRDEPRSSGKTSKLASMKFMQTAEASRKAQNDAAIAQIQRELDGVETDESDGDDRGRRKFGPQSDAKIALPAQKPQRAEFEERDDSDAENAGTRQEDEGSDVEVVTNGKDQARSQFRPSRARREVLPNQEKLSQAETADVDHNPWMEAPKRNSKKTHASAAYTENIDANDVTPELPQLKLRASKASAPPKAVSKNVRLLPEDGADETSSDDSADDDKGPKLSKQQSLVKAAFAGDEVVAAFEAEKQDAMREERSPSPAANVLPGWGSWTGTGLNKKDRQDRKKRTDRLQKQAKDAFAAAKGAKGMRKIDHTRRDANLNGVIISEKRMPKQTKYLASTLPHPFETRAQYERSLRVPVGPEWTTKETHQTSTKPRVIMGGGIIRPMEKPVV